MGVTAISDKKPDYPDKDLTYKDAGVDIDAGNAFVERIRPYANSTVRSGTITGLGGYGGLFDLKSAGYNDPVLVSATDGVGTKLLIAQEANLHSTIGIDLVAMCVNDLIVHAAEPLFFLDYLATSKLNPSAAEKIIDGIANGCRQADCALIGGETAEMPDMYLPGHYDLAGFAVGAVDRKKLLPRYDIKENDAILGLASDGLHSNGFSLVRKIVKKAGLDLDQIAPFDTSQRLSDTLLKPTRIYVKSCLATIKNCEIKALAHITGGGFIENLPRVLPKGLGAKIFSNSWHLPSIFSWLAEAGDLKHQEMIRTFNCGIGMILIVSPDKIESIMEFLDSHGEKVSLIGKVMKINKKSPIINVTDLEDLFK